MCSEERVELAIYSRMHNRHISSTLSAARATGHRTHRACHTAVPKHDRQATWLPALALIFPYIRSYGIMRCRKCCMCVFDTCSICHTYRAVILNKCTQSLFLTLLIESPLPATVTVAAVHQQKNRPGTIHPFTQSPLIHYSSSPQSSAGAAASASISLLSLSSTSE